MSKKSLTRICYFLIVAILSLSCIALVLVVFLKYEKIPNSKPKIEQSTQVQQGKAQLKESLFGWVYVENEIQPEFPSPFQSFFSEEKNTSTVNEKLAFLEGQVFLEQNRTQQDQNSIEIPIETNPTQEYPNLKQEDVQKQDQDIAKLDSKKQKARLAIIIDDMAHYSHVKNFKALNLKLIPSFFPPDANHKHTVQYASEFQFFMVHLPLAALNYDKPELDTLDPQDTQEKINQKIASIKKDFKGLKYINNHTGSLFTSDKEAMKKLYKALRAQDFVFVDSRTIHNSKAAEIAKEIGQVYIKRDVFLDNDNDLSSIKKQLELAVQLAHKKGFAIAIGHPRKNTFKALKESKELLSSVELVYLSEVYGE
ncbi:divergent polysaccharide deacetylase family protein [Campylobacter sp. MIT 21-1685]|uniref:divergent polysaccharide deacetylase family protein n=1 Tax=unclassified Campylobacter TaxID=2593542 RepID=UPI00224B4DC1|nr:MULTISPECIES: divergent polysaccharide deacetylase family protein [unclassified Campylobacter]MCX2682291.1 divergent polysaccharide deacetylase family protein [Campylobacter sp. MIT 21-1684]MCX2750571.1 divergent polysaccharide deacetylase family protein [Campylobacter sp. MIT 21-1682]MCX2806881.1 divergent polysaccharide deacetylase family protein [Campylobacter sp. MIT 21-1685]